MRTQKLNRLLILGVAVTLMAGFAVVAPAQQQSSGEVDKEVKQLFNQGISSFENEEYQEAKEAFDKILSMRPGSQAALWMRREAQVGQFARMKGRDELSAIADRFIDMMNEAMREKRRKIQNIEETLLDFQSDDLQTYGRALNRIMGHGAYAIPHLLEFLTLEGERNQRLLSRTTMVINKIGRDAVMPLVSALNTEDALLKRRVVGLLQQVGDRRAVPALVSISAQNGSDSALAEAADKALKSITGKTSAKLPSPPKAYINLVEDYLDEKHQEVGYLDLATGDLWDWNPAAEKLKNKLVYRTYPNYIYFLRQGVQLALEGLRLQPDSKRLQTLLLTLQTVEMTRCELFSSEDYVARFGGKSTDQQTTEVASDLLNQFEENWHLLARTSTPEVVGLALEETMKMGESRSSLRLLKLLADKPVLTAKNGGNSLLEALDYGDKDVRYTAAIAALEHWPLGSPGQSKKVVRVLSAVLRQATAKTALLVFDELNARNRVAHELRRKGVTTVGCGANAPEINSSLNLQPAIDAVFLTANVSKRRFHRILKDLKSDVRTSDVPIYVVFDPSTKYVEVQGDTDIKSMIELEQVKSPDFESMVTAQLLQRSNTPLTEKKEQTVLRAVRALMDVPPEATSYELGRLEPGLVKALRGYSEEVQDAALRTLARFASPDVLLPVSQKLIQDGMSADIKAQACRTLAAVLRRSDKAAPKKVVSRLREMLENDDVDVRRAAAEALSTAGLTDEEVLDLKAEYSRLQPAGQ
mgnify:CR=1 FL=1